MVHPQNGMSCNHCKELLYRSISVGNCSFQAKSKKMQDVLQGWMVGGMDRQIAKNTWKDCAKILTELFPNGRNLYVLKFSSLFLIYFSVMNICHLYYNNTKKKKLPKKSIFFQRDFFFFCFNQILHFNKANTTKISFLFPKAQINLKAAFCQEKADGRIM